MSEPLAFLLRHGASVVFAAVFIEQIGLPLPAAPILLAAGALVVAGTLDYRISEKSSASLNYVRRSNVSVQSGNASYIVDSVNFLIKQGIGSRGKWMATLNGSYDVYDYQGNVFAKRTDTVYRIFAGLDYSVQVWLTAGVGYEFNKFNSTSGISEYDVHRITVRLAIGY